MRHSKGADNRYSTFFTSLEAIAGASEVYSYLPNADVDVNFNKSLGSFEWSKVLHYNHHELSVRHPAFP